VSSEDLGAFFAIVCVAAFAPLVADLTPRLRIPVVVLEIVLGIVIGPQVLGLADSNTIVDFISKVGLAFLFFLAGMEIDFKRIRGEPIRLAAFGWSISVVLGLAIGSLLQLDELVVSGLLVGLCLTTTALGTLLPIIRDAGVLRTRFGGFVLGAGTLGELGPIVVISLVLTSDSDHVPSAVLLVVFAIATVGAAVAAVRFRPRRITRLIAETMHSSGQLAVRLALVLLFGLVALAYEFRLDIILGAFAAGVVVALALERAPEDATEDFRVKLDGIGFGFFVPFFFVTTGVTFDLDALFSSVSSIVELPVFLALMLLVRGLPAIIYRRELPRAQLPPLSLLSATGLPLIVAITSIGLETNRIQEDTAAALVGAGMLSVLLFPLAALELLRRAPAVEAPVTQPAAETTG
jgi:Kef-type K+ transport system membrane component KefB